MKHKPCFMHTNKMLKNTEIYGFMQLSTIDTSFSLCPLAAQKNITPACSKTHFLFQFFIIRSYTLEFSLCGQKVNGFFWVRHSIVVQTWPVKDILDAHCSLHISRKF